MNNKQKISLLTIILLVFSSVIGVLQADSVNGIFDYYDFSNGSANVAFYQNGIKVGETFKASYTGYLTQVQIGLKRENNPNFYVNCSIYQLNTQAYNSDVNSSAAIIATSTQTFAASTVSTTQSTIFTFNFDGTVQLINNTYYAVVLEAVNWVSGDASNLLRPTSRMSEGFAGYYVTYYSSAWHGATTDQELCFYVSGQVTDPNPTPTPTPTASPTPSPRPGNYWDNYADDTGNTGITWMDNTLPYFIPLILIMVCAFLGWYFAKTWGFMAGLNLGVIFAYVIFPLIFPVWGVLAVIIVDGLLIYSKVGRGGSE